MIQDDMFEEKVSFSESALTVANQHFNNPIPYGSKLSFHTCFVGLL